MKENPARQAGDKKTRRVGKGCSSRQPREERGVAEEKANGAATTGCLLPQASDLCASDRQSPGSLLCLAALFTTAIFVEERGKESRGLLPRLEWCRRVSLKG